MNRIVDIFEGRIYAYCLIYIKEFIPPNFFLKIDDFFFNKYIYRSVLSLHLVLLMKTRSIDSSIMKEIQNIIFLKLIKKATRTKYWKRVFIQNNIDISNLNIENGLKQIPPVHKENLLEFTKEEYLVSNKSDFLYKRRTSGSTGVPFVWYIDQKTLQINAAAYYLRLIQESGISLRELFKTKKFLTFFNYHNNSKMPLDFFTTHFKWSSIMDSKEKIEEIFKAIERNGPSVLVTYPTEMSLFLDSFKRKSGIIKLPIRLIILTGQDVSLELRKEISDIFGCKVVSIYSSMEINHIATECTHFNNSYHVNSERIILELLGDDNQPVTLGRSGEITLTCLDNHVAPLIRYKIGDIGRIVGTDTCLCGRSSLRIEFEGRKNDLIKFKDGRILPVREIRKFFLEKPTYEKVSRFQIIQESFYNVRIRLVPRGLPLTVKEIIELKEKCNQVCDKKINFMITQEQKIASESAKFLGFVALK